MSDNYSLNNKKLESQGITKRKITTAELIGKGDIFDAKYVGHDFGDLRTITPINNNTKPQQY